jgi:hypothetical protein
MALGRSKRTELRNEETDKDAIAVHLANEQKWHEARSGRACLPDKGESGHGTDSVPLM